MKRLTDLHQIADSTLGGLTAGPALRARIKEAAALEQSPKRNSRKRATYTLVLSAACVLMLAVGVMTVPGLLPKGTDPVQTGSGYDVMAAGPKDNGGATVVHLDLPVGSINLRGSGNPSGGNAIWAAKEGGNFPLIGIDGKYYRLLDKPTSIPSDMLGGSLGTVAEYTDEPALSTTPGIISNKVAQGDTVYEVSGMNGAVVAANVNGSMMAFQRVSFANNATQGRESLKDTLGISGKVTALRLTGVGTMEDSGAVSTLVATLLDRAVFKNSAGGDRSSQMLFIQLDNGLVLQMNVSDDTLSACGSWSCPEFIEAFAEAVANQ